MTSDITPQARIGYAELESWLSAAFQTGGMTHAEAEVTARVLAEADLRGVFTHGSVRLPDYARMVRERRWQTGMEPTPLVRSGALLLLDGRDGVGPYVSMTAMQQAIQIASECGAGWVWVRNGGHFGAAAAYTMQAARAGFLGLAFTNSSRAMAAWGGRAAVLGANPWSIAIPRGADTWPLVLDLANTVSARGRVKAALVRGETLPEGWALDRDGRATVDPAAALAGSMLPFGGHKGYALAFMVEALTAAVAGSAMTVDVVAPFGAASGPQGVGQAFAAIDLGALVPLDELHARLDHLIASVRDSGDGETAQHILVPGEIEARVAAEQTRLGIALPAEVRARIVEGAAYLGIAPPPTL